MIYNNDVCSLIFYTPVVSRLSTMIVSSEGDLVGTLADQKKYYVVGINQHKKLRISGNFRIKLVFH